MEQKIAEAEAAKEEAIEKAEDRDEFDAVIKSLEIPNPKGEAVTDIESGLRVANRIGIDAGNGKQAIIDSLVSSNALLVPAVLFSF